MAETKMQLEDWLDDLCVRFIINLPKEDLSSVARICFQVEEAQWFYEDFIRPLDPTLPSMSLRSFCLRIFQHCPLLASFSLENHMRAFEEFLQYKTRVPVRGAILLNEEMDSTVLVKGWKKGANWSFPRGKINKDEDDLDCAVREVYEETGYDIKEAGLVPKDNEVKYIEIAMREQQIRLYVFRDIPMDTPFNPRTRKEISKIAWYKLSELPAFRKKGTGQDDAAAASNANKFYMVAPFLVPLKKWVMQQKKRDATTRATSYSSHLPVQMPLEEPLTEDDIGMHNEPVPRASGSPPAIETMEGTNLELQRLLKMQPATQGLQMSPSNAPANHDKGEALMALLRQKSTDPPVQEAHSAHHQIPHTPLDHTYVNAPEPPTPHHHHTTQRIPVPSHQPPPSFPIAHGTNQTAQNVQNVQNTSSGYFSYARPHVNLTPQSFAYGRNPYVNPAQQARKEPVLLHPQPLPPQVQQSILVRGILPTPQLPDTTNQSFAQPPPPSLGSFPGQKSEPFQTQTQDAKMPPPLTGHRMSLLNAFKNENRQQGENKAPGSSARNNALPSPSHQGPTQSQAHYGSTQGPWANTVSNQASNPATQYLPHYATGHNVQPSPDTRSQGVPSPATQASGTRSGQPSEAHRSALLDMFKKAGPISPNSSDSTVIPGKARSGMRYTPQEESRSPVYRNTEAAEAAARASEINGSPVRMNPEANLPYRAVQILSRQKQPEVGKDHDIATTQLHNHAAASMNSTQYEMRNSGYRNQPSPRDRGFAHQGGENQGKGSPRFSLAAQAAGRPYGHSPQHSLSSTQNVSSFQPQPTNLLQQRQNPNPEQKQKLLSLFGKSQQSSPTGFGSDDKSKFKEASMHDQIRPRSRVASLASAGGDNIQGSAPTSRRGSGTPISPADRNFLLSYLESVSSGGR
ncbi:hypothetical protein B0H67DRAFT_646924 [Lasiosphaeris hirsuta]|uniref:Nudix hydrolase domain-containing protein n=1 Tax=Lasiosphaeris hirsuta TaxID=260670 RepID=A0AA40A937_9PEZI|nr:hypothetical protein B0H67DRAFT_646924 [Lasiosphaeris hirsuta]